MGEDRIRSFIQKIFKSLLLDLSNVIEGWPPSPHSLHPRLFTLANFWGLADQVLISWWSLIVDTEEWKVPQTVLDPTSKCLFNLTFSGYLFYPSRPYLASWVIYTKLKSDFSIFFHWDILSIINTYYISLKPMLKSQ